ncbi:FAD-binding monooxygenase [Syncephalis pseudoplumigaleata]|uniref:FAD-binding monooxygenase n=1 Tax=Syncephalis pseudoplumigaleata TaxID=1712513 RepID=A0A4P9Z443_9FUNG|nr:FAD-binding monooxygenase [Syncephalis pseudoplumigaleata]|eukprot:RKP26591.1 FAD-binding monooxygenase [Syncephalis pseudoplumigaleata]
MHASTAMPADEDTSTRHPVVIIGAGPVGLMAGLVLTEAGVPVEIYERNLEQMNELRSAGLQPRMLEVLDHYGIVDRFIEVGNPITAVQVYLKGTFIPSAGFDSIRTEYPFVLGCGQNTTEILLHQRLAELGVHVQRGWRYVAHATTDDAACVDVQLARVDSDEVMERRACYMLGCDGGRSSVRKAIGAQFIGKKTNEKIVACDMKVDADQLPAAW